MDDLGKALKEESAAFDVWVPDRGHTPTILDARAAQLATRILDIADGHGPDADRGLLDGLITAYQDMLVGEAWPGVSGREEKITAIRGDLAAWKVLRGLESADPKEVYLLWDGVARLREQQTDNAQAARRVTLYAMNKRGLTIREIAEIVGLRGHSAIERAIKRARQDVASSDLGTGWIRALFDRLLLVGAKRRNPTAVEQVVADIPANASKAHAAEAWQQAVAGHGLGPVEIVGSDIEEDPIAEDTYGFRYVLLTRGTAVYAAALYRRIAQPAKVELPGWGGSEPLR